MSYSNNFELEIVNSFDPVNNTEATDNRFGDYEPYIRYGYPESSDRSRQAPRLHHIAEPIPEATTVSPVYLLSERERELNDRENPYGIRGASCVAKSLQNRSRAAGRYLQPIRIESDALDDGYSPADVRDTLREFVSDVLAVDPGECAWFYSGGRSIHVHTPIYVTGGDELDNLRDAAKEFNDGREIELDPATLSRDWMFRIPGVEHESTGLPKVPIDPDASNDELREQMLSEPPEFHSFDDILAALPELEKHSITREHSEHVVSAAGDNDREPETPDIGTQSEGGYLKPSEREYRPADSSEATLWDRYNRKEFSPYANSNGRRSIVVFDVKGSPFCRRGDDERRTYVPAHIHGAISADGNWMLWGVDAPVQLSDRDAEKWGYQKGDTVVIIGGRSRNSRLIELEDREHPDAARPVSPTLQQKFIVGALSADADDIDDEDGREAALAVLSDYGYDVGSAGLNDYSRPSAGTDGRENNASELQQRAESEGIDALRYREQLHVANRLLQRRGWDGTIDWYREQFGDRFDRERTETILRSVATKYDDLPDPVAEDVTVEEI